jgi:NAD(P)-dependent dehydrogenase (short-subunit alcohol dehydrogenase family)
MSKLSLANRGVVVVGAGGGGIGTAIARIAASEGAFVTAVDRDASALDHAMAAIESVGGHAQPCVVDASSPEGAREIMERATAGAAPLSGLVNVVGGMQRANWAPLLDCTESNFDALLHANLKIAFLTSQAFARVLKAEQRGGSLVQIATIAALQGMPFGAGYATAKAGLLALARTMALEWGPLGLRVNAVAPGTIQVPKNAGSGETEQDRAVIPLGRRGRPEDVAAAVLFLLSDLSEWISGQLIAVDGGASIRPGYLDETGLPVFVRDESLRRQLSGEPG